MTDRKKKVLIMGLEGISNYGENLLMDCLQYIVEGCGCTVVRGDLEPPMKPAERVPYYALMAASRLCRQAGRQQEADRTEYLAVQHRCKKRYDRLMQDCDCVIFGAGSYKYSTQKLWACYSLAVRTARRHQIPVMFNAMNIQKYRASDWKCRFLAKYSGSPNVRTITTRDGEAGVERLRKEYGIPSGITCAPVGDMAYWIPETYGIQRQDHSLVAGINVISGKIFRRYGGSLSAEEALQFYLNTLRQLDAAGIRWKMYTNGMQEDAAFGRKILDAYDGGKTRLICPGSPEEMLRLIASCRVILGARLHSCISAYALDVPIVGFCWDEKMHRFADMAGIGDLFFEEAALKADAVAKHLCRIFDEGYSYDRARRDYWKEETAAYIRAFLNSLEESGIHDR